MGSVVKNPWFRNPLWDLSLIHFGWIPFFIWCVGWLGLGGPLGRPLDLNDLKFAILISVVFQLTHRNYTLLVVYGDKQTFAERPWLFILTPLIAMALGIYVLWFGSSLEFIVGSVLILLWQAYHTVMQRFGLLRAYDRKQPISTEHFRLSKRIDLWFIWSIMIFTFISSAYLNQNLLQYEDVGRKVHAFLQWLGPWPIYLISSCGAVLLFSVIRLIRYEQQKSKLVSFEHRLPRLLFIISTVLLCVIAFTHGPIIFFLSFAFLHAMEYIAFVHHYTYEKYVVNDNRSFAALVFKHPLPSVLIIVGISVPFFYWLDQAAHGDVFKFYLLFNVLFGVMHFTYDGIIWKLRNKNVRKVLDIPEQMGVT